MNIYPKSLTKVVKRRLMLWAIHRMEGYTSVGRFAYPIGERNCSCWLPNARVSWDIAIPTSSSTRTDRFTK